MSDNRKQLPPAPVPAVAKKKPDTFTMSADPEVQCSQSKDLFLYTVAGIIIGGIADAKGFVKFPDVRTASKIAERFLTEMLRLVRPRDAIEEMLLIQMAMVHQRIGNLSLQAADQVMTKNVSVINQALDGACNVFRRQMLALAEYRRVSQSKPLAPVPLQAAENPQDEKSANELGSEAPATPPSTPALPTFEGGIDVSPCVGAASSAVGAEHGPSNGNGQVALKAQRSEARAIQLGPAHRTSATKRVDPATARRRRRAP
jgi:hypothetical protein